MSWPRDDPHDQAHIRRRPATSVRRKRARRDLESKDGRAARRLATSRTCTGLVDDNREKRRIVEFKELPPVLVNALIAAEDNRFYSHFGIDPIRLTGAVVQSVSRGGRIQGTSTLTQQLARNFFLPETRLQRSPVRKAHEIFISFLLEQRLGKEQILTLVCQ